MHRAFAENQNLSLSPITIADANEIHHIRDVLRLKPGDNLIAFNGKGDEADAKILALTKKEIQLEILNMHTCTSSNTTHIILACAIPKKDKFEWIIEKATELGIAEIIPMKTLRTEFTLPGSRREKKLERYKTMAINAAKQCQRLTIPKIHPITDFEHIWDFFDSQTKILIPALIENRTPLKSALTDMPVGFNAPGEPQTRRAKGVAPYNSTLKYAIIIGPEGDFTPEEVEMAIQKQALPVSLGETVLKVETAAISAIAFTKLFL